MALSVSERQKWVNDKQACAWCLSMDHSIRNCKRTTRCGKDGCNERHNHLLHSRSEQQPHGAVVGATHSEGTTVFIKTGRKVTRPKRSKGRMCSLS